MEREEATQHVHRPAYPNCTRDPTPLLLDQPGLVKLAALGAGGELHRSPRLT
jgi:hypothetical protein